MRAQKASATAKVIAASTIFLHTHCRAWGLTSDAAVHWCERFLAGSAFDRWLARAAKNRLLAPLWWALERSTLPGIITHYARRKASIESLVREQLSLGDVQQVVVLGAGFDTLALRLASEFAHVQFHEIDHPATQAVKRAATLTSPVRVHFTAEDLSANPATQFFVNLSGRRIVVAEGLLMYFSAPLVETIMRAALGERRNANNVCIFTYMEQRDAHPAGFRPRSRVIDLWLKLKREPFLWSANDAELHALVARAGGRVTKDIESAAFESGVMPANAQRIRGENIVVATSCESVNAQNTISSSTHSRSGEL